MSSKYLLKNSFRSSRFLILIVSLRVSPYVLNFPVNFVNSLKR